MRGYEIPETALATDKHRYTQIENGWRCEYGPDHAAIRLPRRS